MAPEPTKERLARDLNQAGLHALADKAMRGDYDEIESGHALPLTELANELAVALIGGNADAKAIRQKLIDGDYDAADWEWDEWWNDNEMEFE